MRWQVTYTIPYPDMARRGATNCVSREDAFSWITHAKASMNFLEVVVWFGPKFIRRWHMSIEYTAKGKRYRWEVYKPSTGTKFYVRKKSIANDKTIGKDRGFSDLAAATRYADREVRNEGQGRFI